MIFVTLCAIPCSWFAVKMKQAREQHDLVAELKQLDVWVFYDYQEMFYFERDGPPPGPAWLRDQLGIDFVSNVRGVRCQSTFKAKNLAKIKALPKLRCLDLSETNLSDKELEPIKWMKSLYRVDLPLSCGNKAYEYISELKTIRYIDWSSRPLPDKGLSYLAGHANIWYLDLSNTKITDKDLINLKSLINLETLILNNTNISDSGLINLENLTNIKELGLRNTYITDEGLLYLKKLNKLEDLDIFKTKITDAGKELFHKWHPNCK
jgi:internalin A